MKCKTPKRRREREKRWLKKAWKGLGKKKTQKPVVAPEPIKPKKISWFKRLIIWLKKLLRI